MKKIIILGKSKKFVEIINKLYKNYQISVLSWRNLEKFKDYRLLKNTKIVFVCGYDYNSQWYSLKEYQRKNIDLPYRLINIMANKNTYLFYVDTIGNIKKGINPRNTTLSRYEYAKKMLRYKLTKKFKKIKIIELPPLIDKNSNIQIFGNQFTKMIFKLLILTGLIESIKLETIANRFLIKNNFKQKHILNKPIAFFLNIPRPLIVDRFLRIISS